MNVRSMRPHELDAAVSVWRAATSPEALRMGRSTPPVSARNSQPQTLCRLLRCGQAL